MTFSTRLFLKLFPAVLITLAAGTLMEMIDVSVSGWLLGHDAAEAIAILAAPITILEFESFVFSTGGTVNYLKAAAEFDTKGAQQQFGTTMILAVLSGAITSVIFWILRGPYLAYINAGPNVTALARAYLNILLLVALVRPAAYTLNSLVYADGSPKLSAITSFFQLLLNVLVSIVFCKKYGIAGCALGTLVGYLVASCFLMLHFLKPGKTPRTLLVFSREKILPVFKPGYVDGQALLLWAFLMFGIEAAVVKIAGPEMLSATAAIWVLIAISTIFDTPGLAAQPLIESYMSDRNYRIARRTASLAAYCSLGFGTLIGLICVAAPDVILAIANLSEAPHLDDARLAVRIVGMSLPFWALSFYLSREYIFIGSIRTALIFGLLKDGILPVLLGCFFLWIFGVHGIWSGWAAAVPLTILLTCGLIRCQRGRGYVPFDIPPACSVDIMRSRSIVLSNARISRLASEIADLVAMRTDRETGKRAADLIVNRLMPLHRANTHRHIYAEVTLDFSDGIDLIISNEHGKTTAEPDTAELVPAQDTNAGSFRRCLYRISR